MPVSCGVGRCKQSPNLPFLTSDFHRIVRRTGTDNRDLRCGRAGVRGPRAPTLVHSTHVVVERPASPECRPSTLSCLNDASHDPIIGIANVRFSYFNVAVNDPLPRTARTGRAGTADAMPPGPDRRTRAARARRRLGR